MIAIVEPIGQGGEMNPIKWKYFNPRLPQCPYEFPSQTSTSECIIDYTNLYAGTRLFHQNFGNLVPDSSFLEDVILQVKDRKSTRLNSSHVKTSYAVFCLKKKNLLVYSLLQRNNRRTNSLLLLLRGYNNDVACGVPVSLGYVQKLTTEIKLSPRSGFS